MQNFFRNPAEESGVIKLRRIPPLPRLDRGIKSPRLDGVKAGLHDVICLIDFTVSLYEFQSRNHMRVTSLNTKF